MEVLHQRRFRGWLVDFAFEEYCRIVLTSQRHHNGILPSWITYDVSLSCYHFNNNTSLIPYSSYIHMQLSRLEYIVVFVHPVNKQCGYIRLRMTSDYVSPTNVCIVFRIFSYSGQYMTICIMFCGRYQVPRCLTSGGRSFIPPNILFNKVFNEQDRAKWWSYICKRGYNSTGLNMDI